MTLEKVRLSKNPKTVKFRGSLWLAVTFKINSHAHTGLKYIVNT